MAVAAAVHGGYLPSKFRRFTQPTVSQIRPTPPPLFISTNPNDVNPIHLRDLYSVCNHSCHRFPKLNSEGRVEPVDIDKLRKALLHSYVVASVFTRPDLAPENVSGSGLTGIGGDWIGKVVPVTPGNGELVGFGRAVSDSGLTAAIYDVMVEKGKRRRKNRLLLFSVKDLLASWSVEGMHNTVRKIWNTVPACHPFTTKKRHWQEDSSKDTKMYNAFTSSPFDLLAQVHEAQFSGRVLVNRDIYDIAALCSDQQKPFFGACGFGDDVLVSTTMMYTRTEISSCNFDETSLLQLSLECCTPVSFGELPCPPSFCVIIMNLSIQISEGEHRNGCEGKTLRLSQYRQAKVGQKKEWRS
ncbi:hypothetical protein KY290_003406 [Solanum tuberosum]|uniref:Glucosamine-phosphate N-acetyltransferase n=1 Tax=Solanum tuberosum TaxID=4113 RepID=A0ABQ7WUU7_SOLTU|nr:hypothetical protein KY284_003564 [Solanum tuberosum]KAH0783808.1 hypothetical protein KY290_003406 [Solanum tuberosum]